MEDVVVRPTQCGGFLGLEAAPTRRPPVGAQQGLFLGPVQLAYYTDFGNGSVAMAQAADLWKRDRLITRGRFQLPGSSGWGSVDVKSRWDWSFVDTLDMPRGR